MKPIKDDTSAPGRAYICDTSSVKAHGAILTGRQPNEQVLRVHIRASHLCTSLVHEPLTKLQLPADSSRRLGTPTQLTAVAELLQLWASATAVSGELLATAGSAVTTAGQSHVGGPHAAGHELGGGPPYGPWPWHRVLACNPRHRSAPFINATPCGLETS